jgi:hypothetical protein
MSDSTPLQVDVALKTPSVLKDAETRSHISAAELAVGQFAVLREVANPL